MRIEFFYFDDCPSWQKGLDNLKAALSAENVMADIQMIRVESDEAAAKEKFLGAPSFRINGQDVWPEVRQSYHLGSLGKPIQTSNTGTRNTMA